MSDIMLILNVTGKKEYEDANIDIPPGLIMMAILKLMPNMFDQISFKFGMLWTSTDSRFPTQHISETQITTNIYFKW